MRAPPDYHAPSQHSADSVAAELQTGVTDGATSALRVVARPQHTSLRELAFVEARPARARRLVEM